MRDYRRNLLSTIYNLINNSIVVDGETIETISSRPQGSDYVLFYIDTDDDNGADDREIRELQVAFDCTSIQHMNVADDSKVDSMVDQLKQFLLYAESFSVKGWSVLDVSDNGTEEDESEVDNYTIFRRIFNLKILISRQR